MKIAIMRLKNEWRVQHCDGGLDETSQTHWSVTIPGEPLTDQASVARCILQRSSQACSIRPALADRPVVSRPVDPLQLPPGEEVTLFVSSPLWVEVCLQSPEVRLLDVPVHRPSDTWFGPSTLHGEICYATRTHARLTEQEIPLRRHRALTAVSVCNDGNQPLSLERLKLPVCQLSLYAVEVGGEGILWTNRIRIRAEEKMAVAEVNIEKQPRQSLGAALVAAPRAPLEQHVFERALHALLG